MAGLVGDLLVRIAGDNKQFDKAVQDSGKKAETLQKKFKKIGDGMAKAGRAMTKFVTLPIIGLGIAAVKSAADMEMQQAAFETMLGSAEKAKTLLTDLKDLSAKTPFQLSDLADGTKTLLAFGIELEDVLPTLKNIGDISLGNSEKFKSLALAFGQVQSTGRLMGQDLLQMINVGFNPLQIIAEQTGKTMAVLKDEMSKGAISAEDVAEAFKIATSEGGRFAGGMERASKTIAGQFSTLKDNIVEVARSFGEVLMPAVQNLIDFIKGIVDRFRDMDDSTRELIIKIGLLAAALGPLLIIIPKLITAFIALQASAGPVGLIMAGISAALAIFISQIDLAKKGTEDFETSMEDLEDKIRNTKDEITGLREELEEWDPRSKVQGWIPGAKETEEGLEKVTQATLDFNEVRESLTEGLFEIGQRYKLYGKDIDLVEEKTKEYKKAIEELIEKGYEAEHGNIQTLLAELLALRGERTKSTTKIVEDLDIVLDKRSEAQQEYLDNIRELGDSEVWLAELKKLLREKDEKEEEEAAKKREALERRTNQAISSSAKNLYNSITNLIQTNFDAEKQMALDRLDSLTLTDEEYKRRKTKILQDSAKQNKNLALFNIAVDTAVAVIKTFADLGFIKGLIPAGLMVTAGFVQAAVVKSQTLPRAAKGGRFDSPYIGGEAGPEYAIPDQAPYLNSLASKIESAMGNASINNENMVHVTVNLGSEVLYDDIRKATNDGRLLINTRALV